MSCYGLKTPSFGWVPLVSCMVFIGVLDDFQIFMALFAPLKAGGSAKLETCWETVGASEGNNVMSV